MKSLQYFKKLEKPIDNLEHSPIMRPMMNSTTHISLLFCPAAQTAVDSIEENMI